MSQLVTITSQGQLTIPKNLLKEFGISQGAKAHIHKQGQQLIVEPKTDFWSLSGSLRSSVSLTDDQLRQAREQFSRQWPQPKPKS